MKTIVTGGVGFVGSHLVDKLIEAGHAVAVIDNLYSGKREYLNPKAKFFELDIRDKTITDVFAAEKPDCVFHLAAQIEVPRSVADPEFDNSVNALGSLNVFKAALAAGAKKVIFVSTGGAIYGDCHAPKTEEDKPDPVSPYAIHKYAAERYLEILHQENGLDYIVLRPANMYGPRQYKGGECGVTGVFASNHLEGKTSIQNGDGSKTRDYVFVADAVRALMLAMASDKCGVYNLGRGIEVNNPEIIKTIEKVTGRKFDFTFAPDKPGEVKRSVLSYDKIKRDLGWEPQVGLEEGIRRTIEWLGMPKTSGRSR